MLGRDHIDHDIASVRFAPGLRVPGSASSLETNVLCLILPALDHIHRPTFDSMGKLIVVIASILIVIPLAAHANPQTSQAALIRPGSSQPQQPRQERYYLQVLAADFAAVAANFGSLATDNHELGNVGLMTAFFGAPLIHLINGQARNAGKSLGLRLTLPFILGAAAIPIANCGGDVLDLCAQNSFGRGVILGYVAAVILDATFIARKRRYEKSNSWAPQVSVTHRGASVGLSSAW